MKIMLDCSPAKIAEYSARYGYEFWQLCTPLTNYARAPTGYACDNGFYSKADAHAWVRWLGKFHEGPRPMFVTLPDIVGDAARTLELFEHFKKFPGDLPRALVLQEGIEHIRIPWDQIDAIFIGGGDHFKFSPQAIAAAKTARILNKWVHVGRVNTAARVRNWLGLADSIDGSGISRFDHMLEDVLSAIRGEHPQKALPGVAA